MVMTSVDESHVTDEGDPHLEAAQPAHLRQAALGNVLDVTAIVKEIGTLLVSCQHHRRHHRRHRRHHDDEMSRLTILRSMERRIDTAATGSFEPTNSADCLRTKRWTNGFWQPADQPSSSSEQKT